MSAPPVRNSGVMLPWRLLQKAGRSWFFLTRQERLAILIVLGIFLLGAATRWWLG
jgi:hypothetical protein